MLRTGNDVFIVVGAMLASFLFGIFITDSGYKNRWQDYKQMKTEYRSTRDYVTKLENDLLFISGELRATDEFIFEQCHIQTQIVEYDGTEKEAD